MYLEELSKNNTSNSESHNVTMNILLEFWGKITPCILQLVSYSKAVRIDSEIIRQIVWTLHLSFYIVMNLKKQSYLFISIEYFSAIWNAKLAFFKPTRSLIRMRIDSTK